MAEGLPRRLRLAFMLQVAIVSLVIVSGTWVTVILARLVWVFPMAYLVPWLLPRLRRREGGHPPVRAVTLASWCGVRGAVSLAAALSIPLTLPDGSPFPGRLEVIACTLVVILVTLIGRIALPGRIPGALAAVIAGTLVYAVERALGGGGAAGLAAGGRMEQSIYPDPYGADAWDDARTGRVYVHIVNSMLYEQITGRKAPDTPVTAKTYAEHGYPWYDLYDEHLGDVEPSEVLAGVKSVKEMDAEKGFGPQQDDDPVDVPDHLVHKAHVKTPKGVVADGDWSR